MYWRAGVGRTVLWIAALTFALAAFILWTKAHSATAAQALLAVAAVLSPPVQERVARFRHPRAPVILAFYAVIVLVPIAAVLAVIDGVAAIEDEARRQGFNSAAERERAREMGLASARALADHDAAEARAARERACHAGGEARPLSCFNTAQQSAALELAGLHLGATGLQKLAREAIAAQRTHLLAADPACSALVERIESQALPEIVADVEGLRQAAAAAWAGRLGGGELEAAVVQAKAAGPGKGGKADAQSASFERRLLVLAPQIERGLVAQIQARAQMIATTPTGWHRLLGVQPALGTCKPAGVPGSH